MRRSADFTAAVRRGRRASRSTLVLHVRSRDGSDEPVRVGLIVNKTVGNAVTRHRVARRLRAVCSQELTTWQMGDLVVVRALPASASASSSELASDFGQAARRLVTAGAS